jgi:hypothetical protein
MRTITDGPATVLSPSGALGAPVGRLDGGRLGPHLVDHGREHHVVEVVYVAGPALPVVTEGGTGPSDLISKGSSSATSTSQS